MAAPAVHADLGQLGATPTAATSQTTAAIGTGTGGVNSVIVTVACRISAAITGLTLSDSVGNTYSVLSGASFLTGTSHAEAIFVCLTPTAALVAGSSTFTIAVTSSGSTTTITAYSIRAFELDSKVTDVGVGAHANGSSTLPAVTSGTPASGDYLWVGHHGTSAGAATDTISSSGYTLSPLTTAVDSSGGASPQLAAKQGYQQVTASAASQTFNGTLDSSRAWAALIAAVTITPATVPVTQAVTLTDTPVVKGGAQPVVSESATLTETPVVFGGAQPKPSESLTVSDTPVLKGGAQPVVSEALTVTDTAVVKGPAQPQASEALTVSETAAAQVLVTASTSEALTVTDVPTVQGPAQPVVSEALTVSDTPAVQGGAQPKPSEALTVSEATVAQVLVTPSTSQAVTATDTPAVFLPILTQAAAEAVTVSDTPAVFGGAQPVVSETVTVSETQAVELVSFIGTSQPVTVSEAVAAQLPYLMVVVSETVTVTDSPVAQIAASAALSIVASETLSVTETSAPILPYLTLAAADSLAVTDTPAVRALIRVAAGEQITVSTTVRLPINYIDAQSGTLTFTGTATSSIGPDLNVTWKRQHLYYVDYRNWVRGP